MNELNEKRLIMLQLARVYAQMALAVKDDDIEMANRLVNNARIILDRIYEFTDAEHETAEYIIRRVA